MSISVLEKTKRYVTIRVPLRIFERFQAPRRVLTEDQALGILRTGMAEYRRGKTRTLNSLRDLRHGN